MLIRSILPVSEVNGPGRRTVVWVQGCTLGCPGCWSPQTHAMRSPEAEYYSVSRLVHAIANIHRDCKTDGVTFSGGEPMHQAHELWLVMYYLRMRKWAPYLSIGMFTGYSERELEEGFYEWKRVYRRDWTEGVEEEYRRRDKARKWSSIKGYLDFAAMGRYNEQQRDTSRALLSSRNQVLRLFSTRYKLEDFPPQQAEVTIEDDLVVVTGFPTGNLT